MSDRTPIDELRRRVQLNPASISFAALAEEYRRAGRVDEAIATCTAGLKRHPSYVSARVTLGRALQQSGRSDEARVELEAVLRVAPENLAAIRALAELHESLNAADDTAPAPPETLRGGIDLPSVALTVLPTRALVAPVPAPAPARTEDLQLAALGKLLAAIEQRRHGSRHTTFA